MGLSNALTGALAKFSNQAGTGSAGYISYAPLPSATSVPVSALFPRYK